MRKTYLFIAVMCLFGSIANAQEIRDTLPKQEKNKKGLASVLFSGRPGKALGLSLLLPGAGQVYNKKYWKLPIVYAGFGAMYYFISTNEKQYRRYNAALHERIDNPMDPQDEFVGILSTSGIDSYRDFYDRNLQLSYIGLVVVYLLTGIEAYVDAHLSDFDVSKNLGFELNSSAHCPVGQVAIVWRF